MENPQMASERYMEIPEGLEDALAAYEVADLVPTDDDEPDTWYISDDHAADWAVRKILEEKEEYDRISEIADHEMEMLMQQAEAAKRRFENRTGYLKGKLRQYFETVPHRETKTQEKYQLLSGALVYTKPKESFEKDDAALLDYLKASGQEEYVKVEEKPACGEYKKQLTVVNGKAVDTETGETVEAVRVVTKDATFEVR